MARILLIDDDDQFRRMLRMVLEHDGYIVEEAHNGRQGVASCRAAPADLVITNILMPEQEGLETIRILQREFPAVKIIAISGVVREETWPSSPWYRSLESERHSANPLRCGSCGPQWVRLCRAQGLEGRLVPSPSGRGLG